jgi:cation:H+ antiporter
MLNDLFIFAVSLYFVIRGATTSTHYAVRLAQSFHLSKYTIGFIVIAVISILPETFIAVNSSFNGIPSFGLGTLFASNVADLSLVFFIITLLAGRKIKIESKILKNNRIYPFLLLVPIILGLNGHYSRMEGLSLIIIGAAFYYLALRNSDSKEIVAPEKGKKDKFEDFIGLIAGMILLLVGSHFVVTSASDIANILHINPLLIGMLIVGVGTTIPELFFSLKSVKKHEDGLAVGDIFGTVLADATIVVGILALINPFYFPQKIIYVAGLFMVGVSIILLQFMRSGRVLTKKEAYLLFFIWIAFVLVEFFANK